VVFNELIGDDVVYLLWKLIYISCHFAESFNMGK